MIFQSHIWQNGVRYLRNKRLNNLVHRSCQCLLNTSDNILFTVRAKHEKIAALKLQSASLTTKIQRLELQLDYLSISRY
jgi:hypothetical protein